MSNQTQPNQSMKKEKVTKRPTIVTKNILIEPANSSSNKQQRDHNGQTNKESPATTSKSSCTIVITPPDGDEPVKLAQLADHPQQKTVRQPLSESRQLETELQNDPQDKSQKEKEKSKVELFADRVTVAGLQEAYSGKTKFERYSFRIALLLAFSVIAYETFIVVEKYMNQGQLFDDLDIMADQAPFPNVTICGPEAMKRSVTREIIIKYGKAEEVALKSNQTFESLYDSLSTMASFRIQPRPQSAVAQRNAIKVANEVAKSIPNGYVGLLKVLYPTCSDMFSRCTFGTLEFDCCDATQLMMFDGTVCYHISLNRVQKLAQLPSVVKGEKDDAIKIHTSGLAIEASINWPDVVFFNNDDAFDGFQIFLGPLPTNWMNPIVIPSDMDAFITLAPPKKINEISNCLRPEGKLPPVPPGMFYDPYAVACIGQSLATSMINYYGCILPILDYMPENGTCTIEQLIGLLSIFTGAGINEARRFGMRKDILTHIESKETMLRDFGHHAFSSCLPLCTRYEYDAISASYASLRNRQQVGWDAKKTNRSWSRIRIFFPQSSHRLHQEKYVVPGYLAACDAGGIMGVYAGLSMVTLAQILAYGVLICLSLRKSRRIVPFG